MIVSTSLLPGAPSHIPQPDTACRNPPPSQAASSPPSTITTRNRHQRPPEHRPTTRTRSSTWHCAEARARAHHPPGHFAGSLQLQHHAGCLHQGVSPVPADLTAPRTLLLARDELVDHAGRQRVEVPPVTELHDHLAALAVASDRVARQAHAFHHAEHGISQPGHHRPHGTVLSSGEPPVRVNMAAPSPWAENVGERKRSRARTDAPDYPDRRQSPEC